MTKSPPAIRVAAAVIVDESGRTLVVRKRGTAAGSRGDRRVAWVDPSNPGDTNLAPLTEHAVMRLLRR